MIENLLSYVPDRAFSRLESGFQRRPGPWFSIKMLSYQCRKSHCGDKMVIRSPYLDSGISYAGPGSNLDHTRRRCVCLFLLSVWNHYHFPVSKLNNQYIFKFYDVISAQRVKNCIYYIIGSVPGLRFPENPFAVTDSLLVRLHTYLDRGTMNVQLMRLEIGYFS